MCILDQTTIRIERHKHKEMRKRTISAWSVAILCFLVLMIVTPAIPQSQEYHDFADQRQFLGILFTIFTFFILYSIHFNHFLLFQVYLIFWMSFPISLFLLSVSSDLFFASIEIISSSGIFLNNHKIPIKNGNLYILIV